MATLTLKVKDPWWRSPLAIAAGLDALGVACFVAAQFFIFNRASDVPDEGFFDNLPPAILMLSVVAFWTAGGVVAAVALYRQPLRSTTGRWAIRLVVFNIALIPLLGVINGLFVLAGHPLPAGWGQPIMPLWFLAVIASIVLALISPYERSRGALILPLMLGASTLTFLIGEVLSNH